MKLRQTSSSRSDGGELSRWPEIKHQIYAGLVKRMNEVSGYKTIPTEFCAELNPDVIVINTSQALAFEPQNERALNWLRRRCGLQMKTVKARERISVPLNKQQTIIEDLRADGFQVAG